MKKRKKNNWYEWIINFFCFSQLLMIAGVSCNFLAIVENGGRMPVFNIDMVNSTKYFTYEDTTGINREYYADRYGIDFNDYSWRFSIGDVLIFLGVTTYISTFIYKYRATR